MLLYLKGIVRIKIYRISTRQTIIIFNGILNKSECNTQRVNLLSITDHVIV